MNIKINACLLIVLLLALVLYSCQTTDRIKRTNVNQIVLEEEYKKHIGVRLNDVATFEFIPLETTEKSLLDKDYKIRHVDNETIIITNNARCEVFLFSREGKISNSFACKGTGPNEIDYITGCFWDAQNRELYLNDLSIKNRILVFNEKGIYLRTLNIEKQYMISGFIVDFDKNTFLAYDEKYVDSQDAYMLIQANPFPYILLSKKDGKKVGELPFKIPKRASTHFKRELEEQKVTGSGMSTLPFWKAGNEFIICDVGLDTIYKYSPKTKLVTPLFSKIPELQQQEFPKTLVALSEYNDKYVTFSKFINYYDFETKQWGTEERITYDQQKKTFFRPVFKQNIGVNTFSVIGFNVLPENVNYAIISAEDLHQSFEDGNVVDPKLKEIASKMKEDDNDVLFLKHY